jgi:hypothetical protein
LASHDFVLFRCSRREQWQRTISSSSPNNTTENGNANDDDDAIVSRPSSSVLLRQESVAGNVLIFTTPSHGSPKKQAAFLLQRKLEQQGSSSGSCSIRVGYPLCLPNFDENNGETEESSWGESTIPLNRIWTVQPNAPLVAIHIYNMKQHQQQQHSSSSFGWSNPHAEWHVWQHIHTDAADADKDLFLSGEFMGQEQQQQQQQADHNNNMIYYCVTPWHPTTLWDDLCRRRSETPFYYSEAEARHVFGQIVKVRLQQQQQQQTVFSFSFLERVWYKGLVQGTISYYSFAWAHGWCATLWTCAKSIHYFFGTTTAFLKGPRHANE